MRFPLPSIPKLDYRTGGRYFGAPRARGRCHAACDLIAPLGTEVYAIDAGVVELGARPFYRGTSAMVIRHVNGQVVRYCEILSNDTLNPPQGGSVRAGQIIGHVGRMFVDSMLHFELYAGTVDGDLTNRANPPYQRRKDLLDPTPLLDRLAWLLHA
jgi:murein DD-endopeptidase MepM/ murein hydrolase activator NlpD